MRTPKRSGASIATLIVAFIWSVAAPKPSARFRLFALGFCGVVLIGLLGLRASRTLNQRNRPEDLGFALLS